MCVNLHVGRSYQGVERKTLLLMSNSVIACSLFSSGVLSISKDGDLTATPSHICNLKHCYSHIATDYYVLHVVVLPGDSLLLTCKRSI